MQASTKTVTRTSLSAVGTYGALGPWINPSVAVDLPLRVDLLALALVGFLALGPGRIGAEKGLAGIRALGLPLVVGALLGAAFLAPLAAFPWLVIPALAMVWGARGNHWAGGSRSRALAIGLLALSANSTILAVASSRGMRISPEEFGTKDYPVNRILADIPLHDVMAIDLAGPSAPTLDDLAGAFRRFTLLQSTPAALFLGTLREAACAVFGWEDPRWADPTASFLHRVAEVDRRRSAVDPGKILGIWRVLYAFPEEGAVETLNGTAHVAVAATIGEGSHGARLHLSFRVREVNWTTPLYMRLIDPARRYFLYPSLLRQFAHAWKVERRVASSEHQMGEGP